MTQKNSAKCVTLDNSFPYWENVVREFGNLVNMKELCIQPNRTTSSAIEVEVGEDTYFLSYDKERPTIFTHHALLFLAKQMSENPHAMQERQAIETAVEWHAQLFETESNWWRSYFHLHFNALDAIAQTPYEGDKATGTILLAPKEKAQEAHCLFHSPSVSAIAFVQENTADGNGEPVRILAAAHKKMLRKILVGAIPSSPSTQQFDVAFCYNCEQDFYECLGYIQEQNEYLNAFPIKIEMPGTLSWVLSYKDIPQFECQNHSIKAYRDTRSEDQNHVIEQLKGELFPSDSAFADSMARAVKPIVQALSNQRHGTAAVFYDPKDADNLCVTRRLENLEKNKKSVQVSHSIKQSDAAYLTSLAGIDGALVIDPIKKELLWIMTIVDGNVLLPGEPDRGSRHNGLKTFIENVANDGKGKPRVIAAVFSEDGGVTTYSAQQAYANIQTRKSKEKARIPHKSKKG